MREREVERFKLNPSSCKSEESEVLRKREREIDRERKRERERSREIEKQRDGDC